MILKIRKSLLYEKRRNCRQVQRQPIPLSILFSAAGTRRGRVSLAQKCSEIHHMRDLSPHRVAQMTVEWRAYRLARAGNFNL